MIDMKVESNIEVMENAVCAPAVPERGYYIREFTPAYDFTCKYDYAHTEVGLDRKEAKLHHLYNMGEPAGDWLVITEDDEEASRVTEALGSARFVVLGLAFPVKVWPWNGRTVLRGAPCVFDTKTGSVVYVSDAARSQNPAAHGGSLRVYGNLLVVEPDFSVVYLPSRDVVASPEGGEVVAFSGEYIVVCEGTSDCRGVLKIDTATGVVDKIM